MGFLNLLRPQSWKIRKFESQRSRCSEKFSALHGSVAGVRSTWITAILEDSMKTRKTKSESLSGTSFSDTNYITTCNQWGPTLRLNRSGLRKICSDLKELYESQQENEEMKNYTQKIR